MDLSACLSVVAAACVLAAQPDAYPPVTPAERVPGAAESVIESLPGLTPDDPRGYLAAAEDLLASPAGAARAPLARELLARAVLLGSRRGEEGVSASACLVLIDPAHPGLLEDDADRVWLSALARSLEPALVRPTWLVPNAAWERAPGEVPAAALALARLRNGDPRRARLVLDEPGVLDALRASAELAAVRGRLTVEQFFDGYAKGWPCPECRGDRFIEKPSPNGPARYDTCPHCSGDPGPRFSDADLIMLLRAELSLSGGGASSWSSALAASDSSPLREPDPEHIASVLGMSLGAMHYRDGAWVTEP